MSDRRQFLAAIGSAVALAGCTGGDRSTTDARSESSTSTAIRSEPPTRTPTETATGAPTETATPPLAVRVDGAWGQPDADAGNSGSVGVGGPTSEPVDRRLETPGNDRVRFDPPVVGDGRLFQFGPRGAGEPTPTEPEVGSREPPELIARDPATGERLWSVPVSVNAEDNGIAVTDDTVVVTENTPEGLFKGDERPRIRGFDAEDGAERWSVRLSESVTVTPPTVSDGVVLAVTQGSYQGESSVLRSVDPDGETLWEQRLSHQYGRVVVNDGVVISLSYTMQTSEKQARTTLVGRSPKDGHERWRVEYDAAWPYEMAAADGVVYVATERGDLYALTVAEGSERWRVDVMESTFPDITITDEVLCLSESGTLRGLNRDDGTERWRRDPAPVETAAGTDLVYGEVAGDLVAIKPSSGDRRWLVEAPETTVDGEEWSEVYGSPVVVDGGLYVTTSDGLHRYGNPA